MHAIRATNAGYAVDTERIIEIGTQETTNLMVKTELGNKRGGKSSIRGETKLEQFEVGATGGGEKGVTL